MTFSVLCESPRERHLRRSVPRSVFAAMSLSAFIYFLAQMDRGFEIFFARFEICGFVRIRKGSLTGKAVVLKTTARLSLAGSSPVPSANFTDL